MDEYLNSSWEEFEVRIRRTINSDFRCKIRPLDYPSNRKMIAGLIGDALKRNNGVFPNNDAFIEPIEEYRRSGEAKKIGKARSEGK